YFAVNNKDDGVIYEFNGKNFNKFVFKSNINVLRIDKKSSEVFVIAGKVYKLKDKKYKLENE
ncbi:MAG: hypothetical protein ABIM29_04570, partial [candidate division WOR-3 bacterium]